MNKEDLLTIWFGKNSSARSPYALYGYPPMWETLKDDDGMVLFTRPGKTIYYDSILGYQEVDGVHYQWQYNGKWWGQGCQTTFEDFAKNGPSKER